MTIPSIKKITVLCKDGIFQTFECNLFGVTEIRDKSIEYESSLHNIYFIMKGDTVHIELINVPVIIEHFE